MDTEQLLKVAQISFLLDRHTVTNITFDFE